MTLRGASNTIGCGNFVLTFPNSSVTATQPCAATFSMGATLQNGTHTLIFDPSGAQHRQREPERHAPMRRRTP